MAKKKPHHRTLATTVFLLVRIVRGERETTGVFSSQDRAETAVARLIAHECGLKVITRLPQWVPEIGGTKFFYRREARIFWFRLEPWPVDSEVL